MATGKKDDATSPNLPALGGEGEACAECGAALAADQRYCLNCGQRRTGPRVDFVRLLPGVAANTATNGGGVASAGAATAPMMAAGAPRSEWSPLVAVGCIAILGGMLLLGVLIGNDKNTTTVASTAPTATTATTAAAAPTPTTAAAPTKDKTAAKTAKAGAGPTAAVAGGSGSTAGITAADTTAKTGKAAADASKNSPDVVATAGTPAAQDPNGQAGGGSGATVIK
jgi:hypothetical protein